MHSGCEGIVRILRPLIGLSTLCLAGGVVGGLALGFLLSRQGAWLTPVPWIVYAVLLAVGVAAISVADERRRRRIAEEAWPLPPHFSVADLPVQSPAAAVESEAASSA